MRAIQQKQLLKTQDALVISVLMSARARSSRAGRPTASGRVLQLFFPEVRMLLRLEHRVGSLLNVSRSARCPSTASRRKQV